ncbi:MAG: hypothetical protein C0606_14800 [Hyphomicrobiales bacterium]|nr:MAG: hypothetical protein C0606_14800 [Hyphomicrobiales bacterium]
MVLFAAVLWPRDVLAVPSENAIDARLRMEEAFRLFSKLAFRCESYSSLAKCSYGGRLVKWQKPEITITLVFEPSLNGSVSQAEKRIRGYFDKYIRQINKETDVHLRVGRSRDFIVLVGNREFLRNFLQLGAALKGEKDVSLIHKLKDSRTCMATLSSRSRNGMPEAKYGLMLLNLDANETCIARSLLIALGINPFLLKKSHTIRRDLRKHGAARYSLAPVAKFLLRMMYSRRMKPAYLQSPTKTKNLARRMIFGREVKLPEQ